MVIVSIKIRTPAFTLSLVVLKFCRSHIAISYQALMCFAIISHEQTQSNRLLFSNEARHDKTCFCYMRTTKAQISLRIRTV